MKKYIAIAMFAFTGSVSAQVSDPVTVRSIETLADQQTTFIRAEGSGWGLAGCESAQFVNISDANVSYNGLLATALTAQASGAQLVARGVCSSSGASVIAERLVLQ